MDTTEIELELFIQAIYMKFQYDFRQYSRASLRRRIELALVRYHCKNITELQAKTLHEPNFFTGLIAYLTVNTTEMFRDPTYFLSLREKVIPYLQTFPSIKIWIAGCSTGEEVFSMAIMLRELGISKYLIYATDINPMNLEKAQNGIYDIDLIQKASKNYQLAGGNSSLSDYYSAAYNSVQFDKKLLKNVIFADHSLATDSIFSENHLISCRNVLIYFDRELQDRALHLFDDSLVRGGFLGLGNKETIQFSGIANKFTVLDLPNRIYQKTEGEV